MKMLQSILFSALVLSTLSLGGCMTKDLVNHTFEFNARDESPDIEVLNYQYGDSKQPTARVSQWVLDQGTPLGRTSIGGPMLRGDFLYVKWRIKATGEVIEDTVDLRNRLPRNIENCTIHFLVKERQLYVYLVSAKPNKNPWIKSPLRMYTHLQVDEIYPAQPKF
ncbi:hypothetical protein KJ870_05410 [bacterium]|nr:hypothetical protein [bacterium]MBU1434356.1 hypothetical protein [bacterium]MBU1503747.1 hypothetical protein [bacterium]